MFFQQQTIYNITALIQYLVGNYFAHLTSVLIVYDSSNIMNSNNDLQQQYINSVDLAFGNLLKHDKVISLQWISINETDVSINETDEEFNLKILNAVDLVATEGFITILGNTSRFLHARYYATRYSTLRLKDKIYLFLCNLEEKPKEFLASEILQFYPHHLMVIPENIYSEAKNDPNYNKKVEKTIQTNIQNPNIKQTAASGKTNDNDDLNIFATVGMEIVVNISTIATATIIPITETPTQFLTFFDTPTNGKKYDKYRDINFELWTQQYVGAEGNLNAIHLNTYISCNGTFAKNVQLYPNKFCNLQQRTLRIGSLTYVPYTQTYYVPAGQGNVDSINSKASPKIVQFMGGEAEIMKTFCLNHNCHLRVKPYAADDWGIIFENGSAEGMLGDLYKQHTEMAIGCVYNWYNDITETSQFIARSAVTILGPGPAQYPRWRTNIMPFSNSLWIFLVFTLIICSLMFHFIKFASFRSKHMYSVQPNKYRRFQNYEKTLLDIFAVFIQQPSVDTVLNLVATRIFLAFLLCATITLENTYSGQLKSILTTPLFSEPIDTMHKWSLTGWKWAAPSIIWIHAVENSELPMTQRLAKQFEVRDHKFLYKAISWNNYGLGLERTYSGSFTFGDYITAPALENKIVPKDDLYFDWTRAVATRGWPLMPLLDLHILFCLESGLYIQWEEQLNYKFLDRQVQDILKKLSSSAKPKSLPQKLSIEHISGPLFILLFGYVLAFIILMFELFSHRFKSKVLGDGHYLIKIS